MTTTFEPHPVARCRVYTSRGDAHDLKVGMCGHTVTKPTKRIPTIADRVPVIAIMTRDVVCAQKDLRLAALARLMLDKHIGCMPVVDERGTPHGIVTKFDL